MTRSDEKTDPTFRDPRIAAEVAARHLDLPGLTVKLDGPVVRVAWTDGPRFADTLPQVREVLRTRYWRIRRRYAVESYAAALLSESVDDGEDWFRQPLVWDHLKSRDLTSRPFDPDLLLAARVLVDLAQVPRRATVGYRSRRWDWELIGKLDEVGIDTIRAIAL